jgi:hypothetical protein
MTDQPHQPTGEDELREIEHRWRVARNDPTTWDTTANTALCDVPRLFAEIRRLRSLFSGEDERLLRATRSDVELQGWEHNGELIAPALDDLARRIREARGEPGA